MTIRSATPVPTDSAYLLVQQRGRLVGEYKLLLQEGMATLQLPTVTLPAGLIQLTLFDASARPQAERLVFNPDRLPPVQVAMTTDKPRYQPRDLVSLQLTLSDDNQPIAGALSVSVTDTEQVPDDTASADMKTHLLLTAELRGRVECPNMYVNSNDMMTRRALDDLLLTQGWRRVSGTPDSDQLGGVSLTGHVLTTRKQPVPDAQVILASTSPKLTFVRSAGADKQGRFRLAGLPVTDTLPLLLQLADRQFKPIPPEEATIQIDEYGSDDVARHWLIPSVSEPFRAEALRAYLLAAKARQEGNPDVYREKTARQLKAVTVRARKQEERPDRIRRASIHSDADATVEFDDKSTRFANLYEMMQGKLPGVLVRPYFDPLSGLNGYKVTVRGPGSINASIAPMYLMDGVPVVGEPETALLTFNPGDIERMELLKNAGSASIYGARSSNGIIAFFSRYNRNSLSTKSAKSGAMTRQLIGYPAVQREFYVPRYTGQPEDSARVDRRDVLYWKPLIQTNIQGRTQLQFPLSDVVRTVRISVQGITTDGRPITRTAEIRVQ